MLSTLLRAARARLFPPLWNATYSCGRCGLYIKITNHPDRDRVAALLRVAHGHPCKPKSKAL
ncbi:hypothetical protein [Streptomyces tropicalis]|uniref:Uncharacterized protein n=1 Tax=Streptomyces tropicalis TaxID=3034234 RepID=A0ABT6AEK2_9ACTN|nr:hypothetical protein [Streptomyces tropicalis]MDF3303076.1 hypothetical protein [Streptomyces tropicalis]